MIFCGGFTMYFVTKLPSNKQLKDEPPAAKYLLYFLFAVTMGLIPLTLHRVYGRWKKANADVEILDAV